MNRYCWFLLLLGSFLFIVSSCTLNELDTGSDERLSEDFASFDSGIAGTSLGGSTGGSGIGNAQDIPPGQITAGEWNDLEDWPFWKKLMENSDYADFPSYWSFFHRNRFTVEVKDLYGKPVPDAKVTLQILNGLNAWEARTDNYGKAELWGSLFEGGFPINYSIVISYQGADEILNNPLSFEQGINQVTLNGAAVPEMAADIAFVVDATGSMGDELEYLKSELNDVIERVQSDHSDISLRTGSVFYRDEGDEYVTRVAPFTNNHFSTMAFIADQKADGGGNYPEAVHTAITDALSLDWRDKALARILFLVLDAPPHHEPQVISNLQESIELAAAQGIKIIPITASGIDKETEFLMRFLSISTNGTYTFITDDSGIGNDHLEPTVGEFEVEFLNDLMLRLMKKYVLF